LPTNTTRRGSGGVGHSGAREQTSFRRRTWFVRPAADVGLTRKNVFEARKIRDPEKAVPDGPGSRL
jgi:hypothetical protein